MDQADDFELVGDGLHGCVVVAGLDDEVGKKRVAESLVAGGEVHGDVAEVEGHDGRVGDEDGANCVGAVG